MRTGWGDRGLPKNPDWLCTFQEEKCRFCWHYTATFRKLFLQEFIEAGAPVLQTTRYWVFLCLFGWQDSLSLLTFQFREVKIGERKEGFTFFPQLFRAGGSFLQGWLNGRTCRWTCIKASAFFPGKRARFLGKQFKLNFEHPAGKCLVLSGKWYGCPKRFFPFSSLW